MLKRMLILILLVAALAACAGDGGETAVTPAASTGAGASTASEVEETPPTEVPPTEAAPTEVPATEIPPTETAPAEEAEPAESTDSSEAAGDETAVVDGGEGWGESGTTAQSACDHPYLPLRTGMTWTMAGEEGDSITWEVEKVDGDMDKATAEVTMHTGDLEFTYVWECTAEGITSYEFSNVGMPALGPEMEIEITDGSGFFLPGVAKLESGYSWDTSFHTNYSMSQLDTTKDDVQLVISGEMDTRQTSSVLNTDPVTFQDQSIPGLLVQQDTELDTVMSMMGEEVENSLFMGGETQFGRGLGILRQTSFTDFGDFTMETTDIYVP